jgi:hypothetical protein
MVTDIHPRCADRRESDINACVVDEGQRAFLRPGRWKDATNRVVGFICGSPEEVRKDVVVDIDGEGNGSLLTSVR